jgi:phosphohistidine phosphatase
MPEHRLILIRHAKAGDGPVDLGRPLTARGHTDARAIGTWLSAQAIVPDHAVVSPARRAVQTWDEIADHLPTAPTPLIDERIYDNSVPKILDVTRDTPPQITTLALVGHNPGIAAYADALDDHRGNLEAREALNRGYPTASIAVLTVHGAWADLELGSATLEQFIPPREHR